MSHDFDPVTYICRRCYMTKAAVYALDAKWTVGCGPPPANVSSIINQLVLKKEGRLASDIPPPAAAEEADPCSVAFSTPS